MKMETLVEQTKWRIVIGRGELLLAKAGGWGGAGGELQTSTPHLTPTDLIIGCSNRD